MDWGFLSGVRLYATVLVLGLGMRYGLFTLGPWSENLHVLAHPWVLIAAGIACAMEFVADKIPWLDSAWDSFHTFIRPIAAILLSAAALESVDPVWRVLLVLACGTAALSSHATKAAARVVVNHSPEPFSKRRAQCSRGWVSRSCCSGWW